MENECVGVLRCGLTLSLSLSLSPEGERELPLRVSASPREPNPFPPPNQNVTHPTQRPPRRAIRAGLITNTPDILVDGLQAAVLEYRPELLRFLAARRATPDEAEDIIQDLFLRVRTMETGPIAEPRAWLYKVAANLLFDRRRSAARRTAREAVWTEVQLGAEMEIDEQPSAEQALAARQELALVAAAIAALPERTAEILRRYRIDGAEQKAIAAALGISLSAVEKHLQRGYRAVAEARALLDAGLTAPRRSTLKGEHD